MGLLVFIFFFLIVLMILTVSIATRREPYAKYLLNVSLVSTTTVLFFLVNIIMLYYDVIKFNIIISKLFLTGMVIVSFFLLLMCERLPYFDKKNKKGFIVFNVILHIIPLTLAVFFIDGLFWNALLGFKFNSTLLLGVPASAIFIGMVFIFIPISGILISLIKIIRCDGKIYKQQMLIYLIALFVSTVLWSCIYYISNIFSWAIAIFPLGYILLIFFTGYAFSTLMVYDKKQLALAFLRFFSFILIFAVITGLWSSFILTYVRSFYLQVILLVIGASFFLAVRNIVSQRLRLFLGDTSEYAKAIEEKLESIDYTEGREKVMEKFKEILQEQLGCSNLSILILNDSDILEPIYSTLNIVSTFDSKNPAFEFLMSENISIVMRTPILTTSLFADIRDELINFMDITCAEILIFVREGQKLIGIIAISDKKQKEVYTSYDFEVLNNLYSYFFLIIYYLRNIAKQDIVLILDREIEMSDQIIGAIQKNIDIVEKRAIDVDSIAFSAHQLGGDFTDFIKLSEDRYLFLIGDVSGKGLSASMSMVILKSVLHTYLSETPDFKDLVVKINSFIKDNLPRGTFLAGLFGIIDFKTTTIYYLNCGIPLMSMYIDSYKNVIEIQGEGKVLGFVKNIRPFLKVRKITMNRNDIIVFTTDGLLDSKNLKGDTFGNDRVGRLISANKTKSASEISNLIYKSLSDFIAHEIEDDITIMTFKHI